MAEYSKEGTPWWRNLSIPIRLIQHAHRDIYWMSLHCYREWKTHLYRWNYMMSDLSWGNMHIKNRDKYHARIVKIKRKQKKSQASNQKKPERKVHLQTPKNRSNRLSPTFYGTVQGNTRVCIKRTAVTPQSLIILKQFQTAMQRDGIVLLGQLSRLHSADSSKAPLHSAPPYFGEGLSQVRCLVWMPPPQVTEHLLHDDHSEKPPSTAHHQ